MKKQLLAVFITLTMSLLQAMEPKETKPFEQWAKLPPEVQSLILSFTPEAATYKEFTKLKSVNKEFHDLMLTPGVLEGFFRKLIEKDPEQAKDFFLAAVEDSNVPTAKPIIKAFLRAGIDPNIRDTIHGTPALLIAGLYRHNEIAALLLEYGADVNAQGTIYGKTALLIAIESSNNELVDLLLKSGASVALADKHGRTPLMASAERLGYKNIFDELLKKKADINATDDEGWNALHYAAKGGSNETAREIITKGLLDVNFTTNTGETPLMNAATNGHFKIVEQLLRKGAKIDKTESIGWTALHWAAACECGNACDCEQDVCPAQKSCVEAAKILIKNGADIDARDAGYRTPEQIAEEYQRPHLKAYLENVREKRAGI